VPSIHHSERADQPFIAINCAAIPENLLGKRTLGHEKGAFTGAAAQRIGKFEQCNHGTIFLDEIGDMSLATQTRSCASFSQACLNESAEIKRSRLMFG